MSNDRVRVRVEELRADYADVVGRPFAHFYCPILRTDDDVPLCEGHVINRAFGTCDAWQPQREDVDHFYGSMAEADYIGIVKHRTKTPFQLWLDPALRRQFRPRLTIGDKRLDHYFPDKVRSVPGQTAGKLVVQGGTAIDVVIKESPELLKALDEQELRVVVDGDFRPAVVASALKAAHLTMFHLLGYRHLFSAAGLHLADLLRDFFVGNRDAEKTDMGDRLAAAFLPHIRLISPMLIKDSSVLKGTVLDNRLIGCVGGSGAIFALGVVVPAGDDRFCVFLPSGQGYTIDTYLGFLNDPPEAFHAKVFEYCPANGTTEAHWKTSPDDPIRVPMPDKLPTS